MTEYHKINTIYKRDPQTKKLLLGEWSTPEFEFLQNNTWEFTEKVDGTNIRVHLQYAADTLTVEYAGRTDRAQIPTPLLESLEEMFPTCPLCRRDLERPGFYQRHNALAAWMVSNSLTDVVLYGEGYGPKIQSGEKYAEVPSFVLFDVKIGPYWLESDNVATLANLDIPIVPVVGYGTLHDAMNIVQRDMKSNWGDFEAEGIVARPVVQMFDRKGERIITKIKVRDFK